MHTKTIVCFYTQLSYLQISKRLYTNWVFYETFTDLSLSVTVRREIVDTSASVHETIQGAKKTMIKWDKI